MPCRTAVIGGLTLISRLFGFARDLALAAALGAVGEVSDSTPATDTTSALLTYPVDVAETLAETGADPAQCVMIGVGASYKLTGNVAATLEFEHYGTVREKGYELSQRQLQAGLKFGF